MFTKVLQRLLWRAPTVQCLAISCSVVWTTWFDSPFLHNVLRGIGSSFSGPTLKQSQSGKIVRERLPVDRRQYVQLAGTICFSLHREHYAMALPVPSHHRGTVNGSGDRCCAWMTNIINVCVRHGGEADGRSSATIHNSYSVPLSHTVGKAPWTKIKYSTGDGELYQYDWWVSACCD